MTTEAPDPIEIFISYSRRDKWFKGELAKHLSLLKRQGVITNCWYT